MGLGVSYERGTPVGSPSVLEQLFEYLEIFYTYALLLLVWSIRVVISVTRKQITNNKQILDKFCYPQANNQ